MRIPNLCRFSVPLVCLVFQPGLTFGQSKWDGVVADTSSPRATLRSVMEASNAVDEIVKSQAFVDRANPEFKPVALRIIDCMDTSALPAFAAEQRAIQVAVSIKEILDREELPPWDEIPDLEAIEAPGGLDK